MHTKSLIMADQDELIFQSVTDCWICQKPLDDNSDRDHGHITGKFRGAAHNDCDINYKLHSRIAVFCHNLKNYDAHIIIDAITHDIFESLLNIISRILGSYILHYKLQ